MGKLANFIGFFGLVFLLFVAAILLLSSIRIINAGEVGIKTEFGRVVDVLEPNMHLVIPIMNDVKYMSTQIEKF